MAEKKNSKELGKLGEMLAKTFLEERGYKVISQNYFTEHGEIDLVAKKAGCIHFVEVKTRSTETFGNPEEAITQIKLAHMIDSAAAFMQSHPEFDGDWQIDVVAIKFLTDSEIPEIRLFPNANQ